MTAQGKGQWLLGSELRVQRGARWKTRSHGGKMGLQCQTKDCGVLSFSSSCVLLRVSNVLSNLGCCRVEGTLWESMLRFCFHFTHSLGLTESLSVLALVTDGKKRGLPESPGFFPFGHSQVTSVLWTQHKVCPWIYSSSLGFSFLALCRGKLPEKSGGRVMRLPGIWVPPCLGSQRAGFCLA